MAYVALLVMGTWANVPASTTSWFQVELDGKHILIQNYVKDMCMALLMNINELMDLLPPL